MLNRITLGGGTLEKKSIKWLIGDVLKEVHFLIRGWVYE